MNSRPTTDPKAERDAAMAAIYAKSDWNARDGTGPLPPPMHRSHGSILVWLYRSDRLKPGCWRALASHHANELMEMRAQGLVSTRTYGPWHAPRRDRWRLTPVGSQAAVAFLGDVQRYGGLDNVVGEGTT